MQYQSFSYTPTELAESLTSASHDTLNWLYRNKYITQEQYNEVSNRIVVMAIPNKKGFGKRLLERFFGATEDDNVWVFPIVEVDPYYNNYPPTPKPAPKKKPTLKVVD